MLGGTALVDLAATILLQAYKDSQILLNAHKEGRRLTKGEWDVVKKSNTDARAELVAAIEKAEREGR